MPFNLLLERKEIKNKNRGITQKDFMHYDFWQKDKKIQGPSI